MKITLILGILIAFAFFYNLRKMIRRAARGQSLDGCDGDCACCSASCRTRVEVEKGKNVAERAAIKRAKAIAATRRKDA